ncbi:uncharacterized protein LOC106051178 isoform X2 [Biomphalaria glabrata]|uniref:Uncharacterized protein LOC106051178 isoform X2 n=1 Tax=Biomphalaria glabrata TaxID=6526 RepID=A0A9W2YRK6_BIOGL|nr:uncharacterized protein LOC106051178 isoform X2 [Biomphalaria glabrata]
MFKSNCYYLWGERTLGQTHFILGTVCFFSCLDLFVCTCSDVLFTTIIDSCFLCSNQSVPWNQTSDVCSNYSAQLATISSDNYLAPTASICSTLKEDHHSSYVWIGSYTQQYQKVVQSEVTVEAKPDSLFDNVCSTLNLDLKSIVSKPCTSSYPVLCQADITDEPTKNCSLTCINSYCHSLTGACNEGCTVGFTGDKCQRACPAQCFGKLCERNDSFCSKGCLPGYTGIHCLKACLNCAGNGSCHQITGACYSGCLQGYSGDSCLLASRSFGQDPTTFTSIGLVACVAILIMVCISLYRIKIQKKLENVSFPTYGTRNRRMATVLDLDE